MIVDVHGRLAPPDLLAAIRKDHARMPSLRPIEEQGALALQFGKAKPTGPAMKGPSDTRGLIHADSIVHDPRVLRFVIEMMGPDRIMLGSDMPFPAGDHDPRPIVAAVALEPDQVKSIEGGLAARLFRTGQEQSRED